jgi:hypothetical protein
MCNAEIPVPSVFQTTSRNTLANTLPGWNAEDAPVGVEYTGATNWSIPAGDLFHRGPPHREDRLAQRPPNLGPTRERLTIDLNQGRLERHV